MSSGFPAIESLIPQAGPMRLLERVIAHDVGRTRCVADPARADLFADPRGEVPGWVAIELMAQCAAVHGALGTWTRGEPSRPGLFVGARRVTLAVAHLGREPLDVEVTHVRGEIGMVALDGIVRGPDGALVAEGRLHFYVAENLEALTGSVDGG